MDFVQTCKHTCMIMHAYVQNDIHTHADTHTQSHTGKIIQRTSGIQSHICIYMHHHAYKIRQTKPCIQTKPNIHSYIRACRYAYIDTYTRTKSTDKIMHPSIHTSIHPCMQLHTYMTYIYERHTNINDMTYINHKKALVTSIHPSMHYRCTSIHTDRRADIHIHIHIHIHIYT